MTNIEMLINKYNISDNGDGNLKCRFPKGRKPTDAEVNEIRSAKPAILAYFAKIKAAAADRERKISSIPGLAELEKSRDEWAHYRDVLSDYIESGRCTGGPRKPSSDPKALAEKYPRAAAYLKALSFEHASNHAKSAAGAKARTRIINGEDHTTAIAEMETEWSAAAHEAVMNS